MRAIKAKVTLSFASNDFHHESMSDEMWREHVKSLHNPGLPNERRLTLRSLAPYSKPSALKRELVEAGFAVGDEVLICDAREVVEAVKMQRQSTPLTFDELSVGDHFIAFPTDGDDHGHCGYRHSFKLCRKTRPCSVPYDALKNNYVRIFDGVESSVPPTMEVIKVWL